MSGTEERKASDNRFGRLVLNKFFHRVVIGLVVLLVSYIVVLNGAEFNKYQLKVGDKSEYDIYAPRDVEDTISTKKNQEAAAAKVTPKYSRDDSITTKALETVSNLIKNLASIKPENYTKEQLIEEYIKVFNNENIILEKTQAGQLVNLDIKSLESVLTEVVNKVMDQGITEESLERSIRYAKEELSKYPSKQITEIGNIICASIIKPNMIEDKVLTEKARQEARSRTSNIVKYEKGNRIVSKDNIITEEQIEMLKKLNLLKIKGKIDLPFYLGVLAILCILGAIFIVYLYNFQKEILYSRSDLLLIGIILILTLLMARGFVEISVYLIPFSFAAILFSMLLNVNLAIFINFILTVVIAVLTKGDINFVYLSLIGGTFAAFAVSRADQRKKMVLAGIAISLVYGMIIACFGIINKEAFSKVAYDGAIGIVNGLFSIILAIGTLPFWESTFNVITPLKLLELSNPNQPLIKRLLLEAPGTYHHSLLVGNLAEVATEAIGGNALLARVAAYFHDVGKLKRPYFFKENQYMDNPHERMTPSLSTLVITSHTRDGVELAAQYGIPLAIKDIIMQHHGTTLVAYFFHKAKQSERLENQTKQESFRYEGPRPTTKESAVVMLADSVEAAVRSMPDKSEGKIEGLVRKLIKDKLEDGQLDLCDLTLKDLDAIARAFMKVLSGCFHRREEYPEIKSDDLEKENIKVVDPLDLLLTDEEKSEEGESCENTSSKQAEKV